MVLKKILASLLAFSFLLCLTGCQEPGSPTGASTESPSTPKSTSSGDIYLPNGLFPESAYRPETMPERYFEETVTDLRAGDYDTRLWPFVGSAVVSYVDGISPSYGLCDENGKIACDAVYCNVTLAERDGKMVYILTKKHVAGSDDLSYTYTLCAPDGSWCETYENLYWTETYAGESSETYYYDWRDVIEYDYITAKRDGKWGVLDFDGTPLLPFEYTEPVFFSEGLAAILNDNQQSVSFIDITGKVLLGPYELPPGQSYLNEGSLTLYTSKLLFHEGLCRFFENGLCGMMDREGTVVIPAEYSFISSFQDGSALCAMESPDNYEKSTRGIIQKNGELLVPMDNSWYYRDRGGIYRTPIDGGDPVRLSEDGSWVEGNSVLAQDGNKATFAASGVTRTFPDEFTSVFLPDGNVLIICYPVEKWYIYDPNGDPISGENTGSPVCDEENGVIFSYSWEDYDGFTGTPYQLYTLKGERLLPGSFTKIECFGDHYLVIQGTSGGLMDKDGNWVLKISLRDYLGD